MIAETVANTAARVEDRATQALPQIEGAVKARLVKPIDKVLKAPRGGKKTAKKAAPARRTTVKKAARSTAKRAAARPRTRKAARKTTARRAASRKKRG